MTKISKSNNLPANIRLRVEADHDLDALDHSQQIEVYKALKKVAQNPAPQSEGGYGKPLGNRNGADLTGCLKIKLKKSGIRIVYQYLCTENGMDVIVIGIREDSEVYRLAAKRLSD